MGEVFWVVREGDVLLYMFFLVDLVGSVLEFVINVVIDFVVLVVVVLVMGVMVVMLGCSVVLFVGIVVGVMMLLSGVGEKISKVCEDIVNSFFLLKIEGYILIGLGDIWINSKWVVWVVVMVLLCYDVEILDVQVQVEVEEEKCRQDVKLMWDVVGEYLDVVKGWVENMVKGVVFVVSWMGLEEGWVLLGNDVLVEVGDMFFDMGYFILEMWQFMVVMVYLGFDLKQDDKIDCYKYFFLFIQFMVQKLQVLMDDLVGMVLGVMNIFDVLEVGFQVVSVFIGSVLNLFKGDDELFVVEYIVEGMWDVCINSQFVVCSGVCCICEVKVVDEFENGVYVFGDVCIGGLFLVVWDIKSGKL